MDHWIFRNSDYLRAWVVMLLNVNWEDKKVLIDGELIECKRGQSVMSIESWAEVLGISQISGGWTRQKTRTFFNVLEKDGMITLEGLRRTTRVTICNYTTYQDVQPQANQQPTNSQPTDNQQITTTKEDKEIKNEKKLPFKQFIQRIEKQYIDGDLTLEEKNKKIEEYK